MVLSSGWLNVWPTLRLDLTNLSPSPAVYSKKSKSIRISIRFKAVSAPQLLPALIAGTNSGKPVGVVLKNLP